MSSQLIASAESVARRAPVGMLEVTTGMREGVTWGGGGRERGGNKAFPPWGQYATIRGCGNDPPFLYR